MKVRLVRKVPLAQRVAPAPMALLAQTVVLANLARQGPHLGSLPLVSTLR